MKAIPAVEATSLAIGHRRRRTAICGDLNLALAAGEFVCLVGRNGVGKTTLLRTLSGVQRPLSGHVRLAGRDAAGLRQIEIARLVGLVQTQPIEIGALSAYQMVALGRYPHVGWGGQLSTTDHAVVRRAIAAVGAAAVAHRDVGELSDGERQRINIARALAQEPAVLLLDEPMAFLDLPSRMALVALLRRLAREEGVAIVAATHDLDLALRNADRIWLMTGSRLHAGVPDDLVLAGHLAAAFGVERSAFSLAPTLAN